MLSRLLGALSLFIALVFGLIAVLVIVSFAGNRNSSLLVLLVVFAALTWVFGAVGWQFIHVPRNGAKGRSEKVNSGAAAADVKVGGAAEETEAANDREAADSGGTGATEEQESVPAVTPCPHGTFVGFEEAGGGDEKPRGRFRKPGERVRDDQEM